MKRLWLRFKNRFIALDYSFRERPLRERALVVACVGGIVFVGVDQLMIQPVQSESETRISEIAEIGLSISKLEAELATLTDVNVIAVRKQQQDEISRLREQIDQIAVRLREEVTSLIPPEQTITMLEEILAEQPELKLLSLVTHTPQLVGAPVETAVAAERGRLYRHALSLEIAGPYPETVDYLQHLENSKWRLLWDSMIYQVEEYPRGITTIELHTLSDEEWFGV
jgi:MSHA biogenesis protein MshJ